MYRVRKTVHGVEPDGSPAPTPNQTVHSMSKRTFDRKVRALEPYFRTASADRRRPMGDPYIGQVDVFAV